MRWVLPPVNTSCFWMLIRPLSVAWNILKNMSMMAWIVCMPMWLKATGKTRPVYTYALCSGRTTANGNLTAQAFTKLLRGMHPHILTTASRFCTSMTLKPAIGTTIWKGSTAILAYCRIIWASIQMTHGAHSIWGARSKIYNTGWMPSHSSSAIWRLILISGMSVGKRLMT